MIESVPLSWTLVVAFTATGVWFVVRGLRPRSRGADRVSHLAHALMAAAMVAMVWPMG